MMLKVCVTKVRLPNLSRSQRVYNIRSHNHKSTSANYAKRPNGVTYGFLSKSIESVSNNETKLCLVDKFRKFTYNDILSLTRRLSSNLIDRYRREANISRRVDDLNSAKVGIYCTNNYTYLISILAVWLANGVPFCLNKNFPPKFIEYYLDDSQCKLVINSKNESVEVVGGEFDELLERKKIVNFKLDESFHSSSASSSSSISFDRFVSALNENETEREALLLYTSGTSGPSKGVVITFENFFSAIENMVECYKWSSNDFCLNPLPINHYSGLVYCLLTPFFVGASVNLLPKFNAEIVWRKLLELDPETIDSKLNLFIAVPTIYSQLVHTYATNEQLREKYPIERVQKTLRSKMRIIASGSAPLSIKTFDDWHKLTNFRILERYGMTEIGMALSTSYQDVTRRVGGTIGRPCGKNRCRVYDNSSDQVLLESDSDSDVFLNGAETRETLYGELQVKGPNVFKKYFNKPKETDESFTEDGWFKTGDTVEFLKDSKVFKIVGRTSVDVIKSGGHKLSALDVERELHTNEMVEDVAVIGLKDAEWGQRVFALIVLKPNAKYNYDEFISWCKSRMPKYSVPRLIEIVDKIPKNQLGKINKKDLIQFYEKKYDKLK